MKKIPFKENDLIEAMESSRIVVFHRHPFEGRDLDRIIQILWDRHRVIAVKVDETGKVVQAPALR